MRLVLRSLLNGTRLHREEPGLAIPLSLHFGGSPQPAVTGLQTDGQSTDRFYPLVDQPNLLLEVSKLLHRRDVGGLTIAPHIEDING